jgi:hypothetical protein
MLNSQQPDSIKFPPSITASLNEAASEDAVPGQRKTSTWRPICPMEGFIIDFHWMSLGK